MENLSIEQANDIKENFKAMELPESLRRMINGIGICAVQNDPTVYGIAIRLSDHVNHADILAFFSPELHENVQIKTVGAVRRFN